MALSACNGRGLNEGENKNIFLEDTLAHDEIFNIRESGNRELMPRRADPVVHPDSDASIGVQSFEEGGNVHFRFVAAVTFTEENIAPTVAEWRRTVSSPDGTSYPKDTDDIPCTTAYKKISNGGSAYSIDDFNEDNGTSYTHFVVYTLRNIPLATYGSYYVSAYLHLSGTGGVNQITKAIAIRVDQEEKYTYVNDVGKYFLTGSFTSTPIMPTAVRPGGENTNIAEFDTGYDLDVNDTAVINEFYDTKLFVHGYSQRTGSETPYYFSNNNDQLKAKYKGNYKFFLTGSNGVASWGQNVVKPLYVYTKDFSWWGAEGRFTGIWAFNNTTSVSDWFEVEESGNYLVTKVNIDPTIYAGIDVVEMKSSATYADKSTWWSNKNNQTSDTGIPHNNLNDCAYIKDGGYGTFYVDWSPKV